MRQFNKKFKKMTTRLLDLPEDVVFDLPRITMIGNMQCYIENHEGIIQFTSNKLLLKIPNGRIEVTGEDLVIRTILSEEMMLEGTIEGYRYLDS
ncbi:sporulation protein YqfC [Longirhabdus pacifica]|uniref:sporulation protein YqfC n=1 Tax=Longirhabdus pacifica TaxID=2305227 RepID=UPI001008EBB0|nr:sporulation protein YqfC [Longirhabdus pacifica]